MPIKTWGTGAWRRVLFALPYIVGICNVRNDFDFACFQSNNKNVSILYLVVHNKIYGIYDDNVVAVGTFRVLFALLENQSGFRVKLLFHSLGFCEFDFYKV